jgi:hypothetical protein
MKEFLHNQRINRRIKPLFSPRREYGHIFEPIFSSTRKLIKSLDKTGKKRIIVFSSSSAVLAALVFVIVALIGARRAPASEASADGDLVQSAAVSQTEMDSSRAAVGGGDELPNINREHEITHTVMDGETFSEIAYIYKIDVEKLAIYNRIPDINRIKEGTVIKIPSEAAEKKITPAASYQVQKLTAASNPVKRIESGVTLKIETEQQRDSNAVTVHFYVKSPPNVEFKRWEWNLGNGRKSFRPSTFWTYDEPGTLTAVDGEGRTYSADDVLIDVPHPATYQNISQIFLTLESMEQTFTVTGKVNMGSSLDGKLDVPMVEVSTNEDSTTYRATRPGFFRFEAEKDGMFRTYYVFASPVESKHSDRSDMNWYRTQFNTGTQSNCGPTVAAMAISWATGEYVPVSTVRHEVKWTGDGSTSFEELMKNMKAHKTETRIIRAYAVQDIIDIIDRGNVAIVLFNSGGVKFNKYPENDLFGKYYNEAVGHYVVIKGYSTDGQYFVVYDPIPSDWASNSFRYDDGISMIGRNRYFDTKGLFNALRRNDVIEVLRTSPAELGY